MSKMFEERKPTPRNPNQNRATLSTNISATANRKKGYYTNHDPNKQEVGFIFK